MSLVNADTGDVVPALDELGARRLTDEIKASAEHTWELLERAHKGQAWVPLGYRTWADYVGAEFGMSRSHAYRLLDQATVMHAIGDVTGVSPNGDISEAEARDIKPHLAEVTGRIAEAVKVEPERVKEIVREVINEVRAEHAEQQENAAAVRRINAMAPEGFNPVQDQAEIQTTFQLFEAIEAIDGLPTPADVARLVRPQSAYRLEPLTRVWQWLDAFIDEWTATE